MEQSETDDSPDIESIPVRDCFSPSTVGVECGEADDSGRERSSSEGSTARSDEYDHDLLETDHLPSSAMDTSMDVSVSDFPQFTSVVAVEGESGREDYLPPQCYDHDEEALLEASEEMSEENKKDTIEEEVIAQSPVPDPVPLQPKIRKPKFTVSDFPTVSPSLSTEQARPLKQRIRRQRVRRVVPIEEEEERVCDVRASFIPEEHWRERETFFFEMAERRSCCPPVELPVSGYYESIVKFSSRYRAQSNRLAEQLAKTKRFADTDPDIVIAVLGESGGELWRFLRSPAQSPDEEERERDVDESFAAQWSLQANIDQCRAKISQKSRSLLESMRFSKSTPIGPPTPSRTLSPTKNPNRTDPATAAISYLCEVTLPQDALGVSPSSAHVVGFEIRPPSSPSKHSQSTPIGTSTDDDEDVLKRLYYVIQLQVRTRRSQANASYTDFLGELNHKCEHYSLLRKSGGEDETKSVPLSPPRSPPKPGFGPIGSHDEYVPATVSADTARGIFAIVSEELANRASDLLAQEEWRVITVKKSLPMLCAFHSSLCAILEAIDISPPAFPDPYDFGLLSDLLSDSIAAVDKSSDKKRRAGKALSLGKTLDESTKVAFESMLEALQVYFQNTLALFEFMDELEVEHSHSLSLSPPQPAQPDAAKFSLVARQVGKLFSRLLVSADLHAMLSTADLALGSLGSPSTQKARERDPDLGNDDGSLVSSAASEAAPASVRDGDQDLEREKLSFWAEEVRGGLSAHLECVSHNDSRFYAKDEADLLKVQHDRCMSCGETLKSNLLGFGKNYALCRFFGGLFCKKWCHRGDHRPIPHRVVHFWDCKAYSVCKLAALFIDKVWDKPLLSLSKANPLLFDGVQGLQQVVECKKVISSLLPLIFFDNPEKIILALSKTITKSRSHLLFTDDLYSMDDLLAVYNGTLVESIQRLANFMVKLRDSMFLQKASALL